MADTTSSTVLSHNRGQQYIGLVVENIYYAEEWLFVPVIKLNYCWQHIQMQTKVYNIYEYDSNLSFEFTNGF